MTDRKGLSRTVADYFNPHEREARDHGPTADVVVVAILIHTSVKLVTRGTSDKAGGHKDFNPHEREARDQIAL